MERALPLYMVVVSFEKPVGNKGLKSVPRKIDLKAFQHAFASESVDIRGYHVC